ncbi:MAG TPA: hypothetical protein VF785_04720 [Gemmatimonadaceae bacterium]
MRHDVRHHLNPGSIVGAFILAASLGASMAATHAARRLNAEADACALLTADETSKALEVTSLPGKRLVASSPKVCIWSDDPNHGAGSRRVTVSIMTAAAFAIGKSGADKRVTIEPASGIGDEAYYELFKSDSPFLVVRKGGTAFNLRILNGLKLKAFTLEQEKAKEADLAKAAASRL